MKRFLLFIVTCFVLVSFVALSPKTVRASGGFVNNLLGVTSVGRDNVWAVGEANATTHSQTLVERLQNHVWQIVPSPNPSGSLVARLSGVASLSVHDVWAVGDFALLGETTQTLIEHWNGTQWQIVPSPNLSNGNALAAVTAISVHDVWAVGTLIEHWNGQTWQIVPNPNGAPSSTFLNAITFASKNDVWAVGNFTDSSNVSYGIIERWNGQAWSVIPNPAPENSFLQGVTAISHKDVWAVGYFRDSNGIEETFTEHWNGYAWQVIASSNPAHGTLLRLMGVTAVSYKDVWAVGFFRDSNGVEDTLTERWNGYVWQIIPSPTPNASSELNGVAAGSHKGVWTVGGIFAQSGSFTLTEHWNGQSWSIVSSPTP